MAQATRTKNNAKESIFRETFSSFSVDDVGAARDFYSDILGLNIREEEEGLAITFEGGGRHFIYPKENHKPATFTVLNFTVDDISAAVEALKGKGVKFESFDGGLQTDEQGIHWGTSDGGHGPNIAWFKDPAGNFLAIMEG